MSISRVASVRRAYANTTHRKNTMQHIADVTFRFAAPRDAETVRAIEFEAGLRFISVGMPGLPMRRR